MYGYVHVWAWMSLQVFLCDRHLLGILLAYVSFTLSPGLCRKRCQMTALGLVGALVDTWSSATPASPWAGGKPMESGKKERGLLP